MYNWHSWKPKLPWSSAQLELGKITETFSDNSSKLPQQCPGTLDCPWPLAEPAETNANYCQFCWFILQCRHLWTLKSSTIAIASTQVTTEPSAGNNCHSLHPLKMWAEWQHRYESHCFPLLKPRLSISHTERSQPFPFFRSLCCYPNPFKTAIKYMSVLH